RARRRARTNAPDTIRCVSAKVRRSVGTDPRAHAPTNPRTMKAPSFHWFRTVFFLIPCISVYTIVLGTLSILSTFVDRRGHAAHWCARAWSWLILATTGVAVTVEGLEQLTPGATYMFVSNHQSIYDTPVVFSSLPYQLRIIAQQ